MKLKITISIGILSLFFLAPLSKAQIAGTFDYSLGESSVMRLPSPSALFFNPGELARIHQEELNLSTNRFSGLPEISIAEFIPFTGTFGLGIGNEFGVTQYSIGYARIYSDYNTLGGAINYLKGPSSKDVTLSIGGTVHYPDNEGKNSGILAGASIINFSSNNDLPGRRYSAGAGYWLKPNKFLLQGGWLYEEKKNYVPIGVEYLFNADISFLAGTKSFKDFFAGVNYTLNRMNLDLAVGKEGISFGINIPLSEDSRGIRDNYYQQGTKSYSLQDYTDARDAFRNALQYDEYFESARTNLGLSEGVTTTSTQFLIRDAEHYETEGRILDAKKNYTKVLKVDPGDQVAKSRLAALRPRLQAEASRIVQFADSLRQTGNFDSARDQYLVAFEYNSEDEKILQRVSTMENLVADSVAFYMDQGNTALQKSQYETAKNAYEEVLTYSPNNVEALNSLETVETKIKENAAALKNQRSSKESFDRGKAAFDSQNFFDAITLFTEYLKADPRNKDAQDYLQRSRDSLAPKVEELFKQGLEQYVAENYAQAIVIWNQALKIQPDHEAIRQYTRRAQMKIDALEKLK